MMEEPTMSRSRLALTALGAALVALSGCGPRDDERKPPEPAPTASPTPAVSASPSASIIRPEITPEPVVDLPPPPLEQTIDFPEGGSRLDPAAEQALTALLDSEQLTDGWPIVLGGHSDSAGGDQANLAASRKRAEAVARWLREHDVAEDRIEIVAFGEQNPVAPNAKPDGTPNEAGLPKYRRLEILKPPPPQPAVSESGEEEKAPSDGA
jgi:OOP family OmpA-OmpF porin